MSTWEEFWPYSENEHPTCKEVTDAFTEYVKNVQYFRNNKSIENILVMYWIGEKPCSHSACKAFGYNNACLKDLPYNDELAENYAMWRGEKKNRQFCFWWADSSQKDDSVYIPSSM